MRYKHYNVDSIGLLEESIGDLRAHWQDNEEDMKDQRVLEIDMSDEEVVQHLGITDAESGNVQVIVVYVKKE